MSQSIWISAGGTGGHIYPAVAIYEAIKEKDISVTFIGGGGQSLEKTICTEKKIRFHATNNLKWMGWGKSLVWLWRLWLSCRDLLKLKHEEKPAAILIMGGYPCITSGLIAILTRTPLFLHEQNAVLGRANRVMYPFIKKGFCAYNNLTTSWSKLECVGNPSTIKPIQKIKKEPAGRFNILSFGGSGGAKQLNELMYDVIKCNALKNCAFWHITGNQGEFVHALANKHVKIESYNHEIEKAYAWADLAITRSGAMTLAEITLQGLPSLLLPYPYAANDHQQKNAEYYIEQGGALLCGTTPAEIVAQIKSLQQDAQKYTDMATCVFNLIPKKDPVKVIVATLMGRLKGA